MDSTVENRENQENQENQEGQESRENQEHLPKHCDDYIDDPEQPKCLRRFLRFCRWPAVYQLKAYSLFKMDKPPLFADWQRYKNKKVRVKVVMASRFGDVGITRDLKTDRGYQWRVYVEALSNFSDIR